MTMTETEEEKMDFTVEAISPFNDVIEFFFTGGGTFDLPVDLDTGDQGSFGSLDSFNAHDLSQFLIDDPPAPSDSIAAHLSSKTDNSSPLSPPSSVACHNPDSTISATNPPEARDDAEHNKRTMKMGMEKKKKKGQKRQREPRFAFLTKSEVDHLEDGYHWRKYGQKAVKNSPYFRSYYRCTSSLCGVKKIVERSSDDPAVVITTYEGQHKHPSPIKPRVTHYFTPSQQQNPHLISSQHLDLRPVIAGAPPSHPQPFDDFVGHVYSDAGMAIGLRDHGLLQDLIPLEAMKMKRVER